MNNIKKFLNKKTKEIISISFCSIILMIAVLFLKIERHFLYSEVFSLFLIFVFVFSLIFLIVILSFYMIKGFNLITVRYEKIEILFSYIAIIFIILSVTMLTALSAVGSTEICNRELTNNLVLDENFYYENIDNFNVREVIYKENYTTDKVIVAETYIESIYTFKKEETIFDYLYFQDCRWVNYKKIKTEIYLPFYGRG